MPTRIAIVGGGPGGLLTAYLLRRKCRERTDLTLYEATHRLGGKVVTHHFDAAPVIYEAGVAECYDYAMLGPDPLRQLVTDLGLKTRSTNGGAVVLDGNLLCSDEDIRECCGPGTLEALAEFRRRSVSMLPVEIWYSGGWQDDNRHPWAHRTCEEILNEVTDPVARRYLRIAVHSDVATEPYLTSGLNGLKNFLMDDPAYLRQYSIEGGMEMLPRRIAERLHEVDLQLNSPVVAVESRGEGYTVRFRRNRETRQRNFDAVVIALPHNWLSSVEWCGPRLSRSMAAHIAYYNSPGHYLRVSILFKRPFWRPAIDTSWFMLDAFGGCCVYDEGARHNAGEYGVLGWLLAGADALSLVNLEDSCLVKRAMESLPDPLYCAAQANFIEGKVHRWAAAVSGQPGGLPVRDTRSAHRPEPLGHPGLFLVGDYLFDSTLNGVFDSANCATDLLRGWLQSRD